MAMNHSYLTYTNLLRLRLCLRA